MAVEMGPLLRIDATPEFSLREFLIIAAMVAVMTIDDLLLFEQMSEINSYLVIDYAKKTLLLVACFSTTAFRAVMVRAFAPPDIPWARSGWLNPHVLILLVGAVLFDQGVSWMDSHINMLAGNPVILTTPEYQDDLIKYFDLTFGLIWNSVAEEAFFRAVLITALFSILPRPALCIILAGIAFGLVHWSQGPVSVGAIVIGGWAYGVLFCLTRSVMPGVIVHYIHNLIAFTN